jgi:serine/threonine-protein kinase
MGCVLLAERADQAYERRVALKIIDPLKGKDQHYAERLSVERRLLARLNHPAIARLLDGGTSDDGLPYLVMELVEGVPLPQFVVEERLSLQDTLRLFLAVCEAVDYAHRNLIVHRDLKPSNILVTADGSPRLLDFGIAKLLDPTLDPSANLDTETGLAPMTLRYAAPEQIRAEPPSVATDVYSLGVILYELLTGNSPYGEMITALPAWINAICNRTPLLPSEALKLPAGGLESDSAMDPLPWSWHALRGDLDAITLKALRKQPFDRFPSVAALAADIGNHLAGLPVAALRGSKIYRLKKFFRRNRWYLLTAGAAMLLAFLFLADREAQWRKVAQERDHARQVTEFMINMFQLSDPNLAESQTYTVRQALDIGLARLEVDLSGQTETKARLLMAIGKVYLSLGEFDQGQKVLQSALELQKPVRSTKDRAETLSLLAQAAFSQGRFEEAKVLFEKSLLAVGKADANLRAQIYQNYGNLKAEQGLDGEAEQLLNKALEHWRSAEDPAPLDGASIFANLALALKAIGRPAETLKALAEAEAWLARSPGKEFLREIEIAANIALVYRETGNPTKAASLLNEGVAKLKSRASGDRIELASLLNVRAMVLADMGDLAGGIEDFSASAAMWGRLFTPQHPRAAMATSNLGVLYIRLGDWRKAVSLLESALEDKRKSLGVDHPDLCIDLENLADACLECGETVRAWALIAESEAILQQHFQPPHSSLARLSCRKARHFERAGDLTKAEDLARQGLAMYEQVQGPDSPAIAAARKIYGQILVALGQHGQALPLLQFSLANREKSQGAHHYETAQIRSLLGEVIASQGRWQEGLAEVEMALRDQRAALQPAHYSILESQARMAWILDSLDRKDEARKLREKTLATLENAYPGGHPLVAKLAFALE